MKKDPLRLFPRRYTGWSSDFGPQAPGFPYLRPEYESYSWKNRPLRSSTVHQLPVFWSPRQTSVALGFANLESYAVSDYCFYVPERYFGKPNSVVKPPRSVMIANPPGVAVGDLKSMFLALSAGMNAKGIFSGAMPLGPASQHLSPIIGHLPYTEIEDLEGFREGVIVDQDAGVGGECLCVSENFATFTASVGDPPDDRWVRREDLIASDKLAMTQTIEMYDRFKLLVIFYYTRGVEVDGGGVDQVDVDLGVLDEFVELYPENFELHQIEVPSEEYPLTEIVATIRQAVIDFYSLGA